MSDIAHKLEYNLSVVDYKKITLVTKIEYRVAKWTGLVMLCIMLIVLIAALIVHKSIIAEYSILFSAISLPLILLECFVIQPHRLKKAANGTAPKGEYIVYWSDDSISIQTGKVKRSYPLNLFYGWKELPEYILLYTDANNYYVIPKKPMSDEECKSLIDVLNTKIDKKI